MSFALRLHLALCILFFAGASHLFAQRFGDAMVLTESTSYEIVRIAHGDINNDGLIDILSSDYDHLYFNIQVAPNEFNPVQKINLDDFTTAEFPSGLYAFDYIHLKDMDGDGLDDILLLPIWSKELYLLKNLGNLEFADPLKIFDFDNNEPEFITQINVGIEVQDFDQDGDFDIALARQNKLKAPGSSITSLFDKLEGHFTILLNNGIGDFSTINTQFLSMLPENPEGSFSDWDGFDLSSNYADIDNDGNNEIVIAFVAAGETQLFKVDPAIENLNAESLTITTNDVYLGEFTFFDFDSDGLLDIVSRKNAIWYEQMPSGEFYVQDNVFEDEDWLFGIDTRDLILMDWDLDGLLDFMRVSNVDVHFYKNLGNNLLDEPIDLGVSLTSVNHGLINNDIPTLLSSSTPWGFQAVTPQGSETEVNPLDPRGVYKLRALELVDLNDDENSDIICIKDSQVGLSYFLSNGGFDYGEQITIPNAPSKLLNILLRDLNNDDLIDIVYAGRYKVGYMLSNGNGSFQDPIETNTLEKVNSIAVGRFFQNQFPDLIVGQDTRLDIFYDFLEGESFESMENLHNHVDNDYAWIEVVDFDNNGVKDIVFPRGNIAWFKSSGSSSWILTTTEIPSSTASGLLDFDKDSDFDILSKGSTDFTININNGYGQFEESKTFGVNLFTASQIELHDINGDELQDLVTSGFSGTPRFYGRKPNDAFSNAEVLDHGTASNNHTNLIIADLDKDGDLDLIHGHIIDESITILEHMPSKPVAQFSFEIFSENNCSQKSVSFINTSETYFPNGTRHWDFFNSYTSQAIHPSLVYDQPGDQEVTLIECNTAGCDTLTQIVHLEDHPDIIPDIDYQIPLYGITGETVHFVDNTSSIDQWSWVFGDGSVSLDQSPSHVYMEPGTYQVELYLTNSSINDCTFSFVEEIIISEVIGLESGQPEISILPNPFQSSLQLRGLTQGPYSYELFNALGELSQSGVLVNGEIILKSDLAAGIYFIEILGEGGFRYTQQLLK